MRNPSAQQHHVHPHEKFPCAHMKDPKNRAHIKSLPCILTHPALPTHHCQLRAAPCLSASIQRLACTALCPAAACTHNHEEFHQSPGLKTFPTITASAQQHPAGHHSIWSCSGRAVQRGLSHSSQPIRQPASLQSSLHTLWQVSLKVNLPAGHAHNASAWP